MLALLIPYQLMFPLIAMGVLLRFLTAGRGGALREGPRDIRQRLGLVNPEEIARLRASPSAETRQKVLWVHAASVGEVTASGPLLAAIASRPDHPRVVITTSTVAGREKARALMGGGARSPGGSADLALLAPMDFYPAVSAFLNRVRPDALILVETELWPATLYLAHRRDIPIAVINGRLMAKSFARYRRVRAFVSPFLRLVSHAMMQTQDDARRLSELGVAAKAIHITGNLKHDIPPPGKEALLPVRELIARTGWENCPLWVAGSVHPGPELQAVLDAFIRLRRDHPDLRLVLAPRHIERVQEVEEALRVSRIAFAAASRLPAAINAAGQRKGERPRASPEAGEAQCLLVDRMGLLAGFYSFSTAAFVGGTLAPVGGHNLLEPAAAAKPVLFGPHTESTAEVARALQSSGGGIRILDAQTLAEALDALLKDPAYREKTGRQAREAAARMAGATERTLRLLSSAKLI